MCTHAHNYGVYKNIHGNPTKIERYHDVQWLPGTHANTQMNSITNTFSLYACPSLIQSHIITSGKNFIKITSVGMGAAKSNETR